MPTVCLALGKSLDLLVRWILGSFQPHGEKATDLGTLTAAM